MTGSKAFAPINEFKIIKKYTNWCFRGPNCVLIGALWVSTMYHLGLFN